MSVLHCIMKRFLLLIYISMLFYYSLFPSQMGYQSNLFQTNCFNLWLLQNNITSWHINWILICYLYKYFIKFKQLLFFNMSCSIVWLMNIALFLFLVMIRVPDHAPDGAWLLVRSRFWKILRPIFHSNNILNFILK